MKTSTYIFSWEQEQNGAVILSVRRELLENNSSSIIIIMHEIHAFGNNGVSCVVDSRV